MYCFQESEPDSLPPPVAFSPPKAPPISAPFVGILTFTIPQSLPFGLVHKWIFFKSEVKRLDDNPSSTSLLYEIASSIVSILITYNIGANVSTFTILASCFIEMIVGSTKFPFKFFNTFPPTNIFPFCSFANLIAFSYFVIAVSQLFINILKLFFRYIQILELLHTALFLFFGKSTKKSPF